jgi:hypothetical protein
MVPQPVSGPNQQSWIRALDRARMVATHKPTYVIRLDAYRVFSARAVKEYNIHRVEVDGCLTYECDCRPASMVMSAGTRPSSPSFPASAPPPEPPSACSGD